MAGTEDASRKGENIIRRKRETGWGMPQCRSEHFSFYSVCCGKPWRALRSGPHSYFSKNCSRYNVEKDRGEAKQLVATAVMQVGGTRTATKLAPVRAPPWDASPKVLQVNSWLASSQGYP